MIMETEDFNKALAKFKKEGLLVEVINSDGVNTMVTPKGYEAWQVLNCFVSHNGANVVETEDTKKEKPKKTGQQKMDSAIKTMVTIGAGISQMMQGIGSMAGDPVKMDMSQAGIDLGQKKKKPKPKRSYKTKKYKRTRR